MPYLEDGLPGLDPVVRATPIQKKKIMAMFKEGVPRCPVMDVLLTGMILQVGLLLTDPLGQVPTNIPTSIEMA